MKIMYFVPHLNTLYAGRTIFSAYKSAFEDLGHDFHFLTSEDNIESRLNEYSPDILFTGVSDYVFKYLPPKVVINQRKRGTRVFAQVPFWQSPLSKLRVNETPSLKDNKDHVNLIKSGEFADVFLNICQQFDPRMNGFEKDTGYKYYTLPLAADKKVVQPGYDPRFEADICFLGTNLPDKRAFFKERVFPLSKHYNLKLYGQDWTLSDRTLGWVQKFGQYYNIPYLKSIRKPKFELSDEPKMYNTSKISINVHESYQREFGGDCNERTFKIPLAGGFQITDDVKCIRNFFKDGEEIVIAKDKDDWFEKIHYFMKNPDKMSSIIKAGRERVLKDHTYHNRVEYLIEIYNAIF